MNTYITDTDFLPDVLDIQYDEYQLLYGVVVNRREGEIYDSIISLCRRHREEPLRKAKVAYWIRSISEVLCSLEKLQNAYPNKEVFIPYVQLRCSVSRLINLYSFAKDVLCSTGELPMKELVRRDKKEAHEIKSFYPIKYIDALMYDSVPDLKSIYGETYKGISIEEIIDRELQRRGISQNKNNSSNYPQNLYSELFLNADSTAKLVIPNYSREDEKVGKGRSLHLMRSIGLIYYILQDLINDERKVGNKKKVETTLRTATTLMGLCLYDPERETTFSRKYISNESIYKYAYEKRFLQTEENKTHIRKVLTTYGYSIPEELREKTMKGKKSGEE